MGLFLILFARCLGKGVYSYLSASSLTLLALFIINLILEYNEMRREA